MGRPVVAIAILKGIKDEQINNKTGKPFTAQEIGEYYARLLGRTSPPVPMENIKIFTGQGKANYTGVAFFVDGRLSGRIADLAEAKLMTGAVSHAYNMEWGASAPRRTAGSKPTNQK